jgi:hypothetical protein
MRLPNRKQAYISPKKLREYLLSENHPVGRFKAKVFTAAGFREHNIDSLREGLLAIAYTNEVKEEIQVAHGRKYVLDGTLPSPAGSILHLRTIWMIDIGEDAPRLVTAYPA